jgi:hypothetical protein
MRLSSSSRMSSARRLSPFLVHVARESRSQVQQTSRAQPDSRCMCRASCVRAGDYGERPTHAPQRAELDSDIYFRPRSHEECHDHTRASTAEEHGDYQERIFVACLGDG